MQYSAPGSRRLPLRLFRWIAIATASVSSFTPSAWTRQTPRCARRDQQCARSTRARRSGAALGRRLGRSDRARRSGEALGRGPRATRSLLAPGLRPKKPHAVHGHDVGLRLALAPPSAIHGPHSEMNAICTAIKCGASKCEPHILPRTPFRSSWRHCGQRISALIQALMSPPNYPRRRAMRPFSAADTAKFDCAISDGGERFFMRRSLQKNGGT